MIPQITRKLEGKKIASSITSNWHIEFFFYCKCWQQTFEVLASNTYHFISNRPHTDFHLIIHLLHVYQNALWYLLFSCWVVSNSLWPHGLQHARLLCPWDFPGKNTGVGCHFLLQEIFPTQGSKPHFLQWQVDFLPLATRKAQNCGSF